MPLSREDFVRASKGHPIAIPPEAFEPPAIRDANWPDYPELRSAVDWLKTCIGQQQWETRRNAAYIRLYGASMGIPPTDGKGRYFDDTDTFGWYLFLADAFLDHWWNYEPMFGSRVIPIFATIGRHLDSLKSIIGIDERVQRIIGKERRQPNGGIFELLVAAAYRRAGAAVAFRAETATGKSYDMDVTIEGRKLAVECKRLETSSYGEKERYRMRELWGPASDLVQSAKRSSFGNVSFLVPVFDVPDGYLLDKTSLWLASGLPSLLWQDSICHGVIGDLDLGPLQQALETGDVLIDGTRLQQLLSGKYIRHANYLMAIGYRVNISPRYLSECSLAILLRWDTMAQQSIDAKARDVLKRLAEANDQLPIDKPGIVHIGFEAVEGDAVEKARYDKILTSTGNFDPKGKPLQYVYCHYFVPESPPDEAWAFDETVQWRRITGDDSHPLASPFLVLPKEEDSRPGPHWQSPQQRAV